jgi:hypothetical protein
MRVQARELVVGAGHDAKTEVRLARLPLRAGFLASFHWGQSMEVVEGGATDGNVMHRSY